MTTLSAVKAYMETHRRATLSDIAIGLDTTREAAHGLLDIWRRKQRARLVASACSACGSRPGGCSCAMAEILPEVWEWVDDQKGPHAS